MNNITNVSLARSIYAFPLIKYTRLPDSLLPYKANKFKG